jgi:uncharacterized protein YkwD
MSVAVDLLIVLIVAFSAYAGTKRGAVLIGLELISFVAATAVALLGYHSVGLWYKSLGLNLALANIAAFSSLWVLAEITCALVIRFAILHHLTRNLQTSRFNKIGGAALNAAKFTFIVMLSLIAIVGLPISSGAKEPITSSYIARQLLSSSTTVQNWMSSGLGGDLNNSLNFFTVSSAPESTEHINLGFTTTKVTVDAANEDAMLKLLNQERTSRGLSALTLNPQARIVARSYSARMFAEGFFSHVDPDGKNPFDRLRAAGVQFGSAGENLALTPTLELAHQGLMNSPGHRANILSEHYHKVGIGIMNGGPHGLMVTQAFTD